MYEDENVKITKENDCLIAIHKNEIDHLNPQMFKELLTALSKCAKEEFGTWEISDNKNTTPYQLIAKRSITVEKNNLKDKFCPLISEMCKENSCLYYHELTSKIDNETTITKDCLEKLYKEAKVLSRSKDD